MTHGARPAPDRRLAGKIYNLCVMDVFTAVADPTRRRLLAHLADGPRSAGELLDAQTISQPAVSRHLKVLRDAGLVSATSAPEDGRMRIYRLDLRPLREIDGWLAGFWQDQLDAFARYVGQER